MLLRGAPAETPHSLLDCPPRREQDRLDTEGTGGRIRCGLPSAGGRSRDGAGEWQGGWPPDRPAPAADPREIPMLPMLLGREHEKVGREPRPVGIGAHREKNRRTP